METCDLPLPLDLVDAQLSGYVSISLTMLFFLSPRRAIGKCTRSTYTAKKHSPRMAIVQELSLSDPTKPGAVSENGAKLHIFLLAHASLLSSLLSDFVVQMRTPFQAFCSNHRDKAGLFGLFPKQTLSREPGRCEQRAAARCLINHRWWHALNVEKMEKNWENRLH